MVKELTAVRNELQKSETQYKKRTKLLKSKTKTLDLEKKSSAEKDLKISELKNLLSKTQDSLNEERKKSQKLRDERGSVAAIFEKQLESTKLFEEEFKELKKQFAISLEHKVTEVASDEKTELLGKKIQELDIYNGNETDTNELDEEASRTSGHDVDDLVDASTGQGGEEVKVRIFLKEGSFSNEVWPS